MKRSLTYSGWKGSIYLEQEFWDAFKDIAKRRGMRHAALAEEINSGRDANEFSLSSAIRVYVLEDTMRRARSSEVVARENQEHIARLQIAIEVLTDWDKKRGIKDGIAPISAVIAGGRANA